MIKIAGSDYVTIAVLFSLDQPNSIAIGVEPNLPRTKRSEHLSGLERAMHVNILNLYFQRFLHWVPIKIIYETPFCKPNIHKGIRLLCL